MSEHIAQQTNPVIRDSVGRCCGHLQSMHHRGECLGTGAAGSDFCQCYRWVPGRGNRVMSGQS